MATVNMAVKQVFGYSRTWRGRKCLAIVELGGEASVRLQRNMVVKQVFGYSGTWQ